MGVALLLAAVLLLAACGEDEAPPEPPAATARAAEPTLARARPRAGEIVVRGEGSPASHPIELRGSYLVRFEQYAPEAPRLDFGEETSFVARLERGMGRESVALFARAARTGRRRLRMTGRYELTVAFGDFPYVIRFTPRRR